MTPPRAILFDCDGVLVDSEPAANRVLSDVLREQGITMSPERCREVFVGLNPTGVERRLREALGFEAHGAVSGVLSARFMAVLGRDGVSPTPGAIGAVEWCLSRGMALACASNSPIEELRLKLRLSGLAAIFGPHAYSGDALGRSKPDPGVYLYAAGALGVPPEACVVIEDSSTGVRAGVAAGMRVLGFVGVHEGLRGGEILRAAGASEVFGAWGDLPRLIGADR